MKLFRSKSFLIIIAILIFMLQAAPAFAWVWALKLVGFGARSAWVAGGSRVMSMLVKAAPQAGTGTGVIPAAKMAWTAVTKSNPSLATLAAGSIAAAGSAAGLSAVKNNWDTLAATIADAKGWVLENGVYLKITGSGLTLSNTAAMDYFFSTYLPSLSNHGPPNTNENMGVYETDALASAAADAKRTSLQGDSAYGTVAQKTSGTFQYIAEGVTDATAKFKQYQIGAYHTASAAWHWFYYITGVASGASVISAVKKEPLTNDDIETAVKEGLTADDTNVKKLIEVIEKAFNDVIAKGIATQLPGWCGAGKSYYDCMQEWFKDGLPTGTVDDVVENGTDTTTDDVDGKEEEDEKEMSKIDKRFNEFISNMKTSSIGGLWDEAFGSIPSSSQCEMSVNLGQTFGGEITYSFCEWEDWFEGIKAVLLLIATITAVKLIMGGKST